MNKYIFHCEIIDSFYLALLILLTILPYFLFGFCFLIFFYELFLWYFQTQKVFQRMILTFTFLFNLHQTWRDKKMKFFLYIYIYAVKEQNICFQKFEIGYFWFETKTINKTRAKCFLRRHRTLPHIDWNRFK